MAAGRLTSQETEELFLGTWTAIALVADQAIGSHPGRRSELVGVLADASALAADRRRTALDAVRWLIERTSLSGPPPCRPGRRPRPSRPRRR